MTQERQNVFGRVTSVMSVSIPLKSLLFKKVSVHIFANREDKDQAANLWSLQCWP